MARVYATSAEYLTYTGASAAPSNINQLLADASRQLEATAFRYCWYKADTVTGMPTNALVLAAFRDAVAAQVQWWDELGDSIGAAGVWGSVKLGSAQLSRSATSVSGQAAPAREIAPKAMDALQSMDLTPDIFVLGEVSS